MSVADRCIVVLNIGFSSLKFAVYPLQSEAPPLQAGAVDGIGNSACLKITASGSITHDASISAADPHAAMQALATLTSRPLEQMSRHLVIVSCTAGPIWITRFWWMTPP